MVKRAGPATSLRQAQEQLIDALSKKVEAQQRTIMQQAKEIEVLRKKLTGPGIQVVENPSKTTRRHFDGLETTSTPSFARPTAASVKRKVGAAPANTAPAETKGFKRATFFGTTRSYLSGRLCPPPSEGYARPTASSRAKQVIRKVEDDTPPPAVTPEWLGDPQCDRSVWAASHSSPATESEIGKYQSSQHEAVFLADFDKGWAHTPRYQFVQIDSAKAQLMLERGLDIAKEAVWAASKHRWPTSWFLFCADGGKMLKCDTGEITDFVQSLHRTVDVGTACAILDLAKVRNRVCHSEVSSLARLDYLLSLTERVCRELQDTLRLGLVCEIRIELKQEADDNITFLEQIEGFVSLPFAGWPWRPHHERMFMVVGQYAEHRGVECHPALRRMAMVWGSQWWHRGHWWESPSPEMLCEQAQAYDHVFASYRVVLEEDRERLQREYRNRRRQSIG
ncbi:hypothetical protein QBC34DRAFT_160461 [Podospora aff. communis PSN243]|uniref:Uncharacterized protein n=1 Tax=Podospora aff. communis PSN243 TaxID=3040156 RepID=A0AAV9GB70_9PEZI|nr:hypothetical protein QBC34DRAFT_160461 [Podospora aff. communis PSN243]